MSGQERSIETADAALVDALRRLDLLLESATAAAEAAYGAGATVDPHRGLYITVADVRRELRREPAAPALAAVEVDAPAGERLGRLASLFDVDRFDLDVVLLAVAVELDLGYERVFGYLQDDVTKRRPTVALALDLLCADAGARLAARSHFAADRPLRRHRLVQLLPDPAQSSSPLLATAIRVPEPVVGFLLGRPGLDPALADLATVVDAAGDGTDATGVVNVWGRPGSGRGRAAAALAGGPLLRVDLARALDADVPLPTVLALVFRDARLNGAVPYLVGLDALTAPEQERHERALLAALRDSPDLVVVASEHRWAPVHERPAGLAAIEVPPPDSAGRRELWAEALAGATPAERDLDAVASRFRLTRGQIEAAAAQALSLGVANDAHTLFAAARDQAGAPLEGLARKVEPQRTLADIVLPAGRLLQLVELCDQVRHRAVVHEQWGFGRKLALATGLNVLFAGPPGTGKTMAAEVVAAELGLDLYVVDLATVVSKYIGETEKNLARIFDAAENAGAVLFFDEADALFGKRSEVRDSHDRYANVEIAYLLQRMERYDGVAILATNMRKNLDEAFARRLHVTIEFPPPGEDERRRIWERIWPEEAPLGADVDAAELAERFAVAGGSIRNIALAAAFRAAGDGGVVTREHVLAATRREYQKLGAVVRSEEFDGAR